MDDPRNKRNSVAEKLSDSSLFSRSARPKRNVQNESLDVAEASNVSVTCNNLKIPLSSSDGNSFSTNVKINSSSALPTVFIYMCIFFIFPIIVHSKYQTFRRRGHVQPLFSSLFQE